MLSPQQKEMALSKLAVSAKLPKDATLKDIIDLNGKRRLRKLKEEKLVKLEKKKT